MGNNLPIETLGHASGAECVSTIGVAASTKKTAQKRKASQNSESSNHQGLVMTPYTLEFIGYINTWDDRWSNVDVEKFTNYYDMPSMIVILYKVEDQQMRVVIQEFIVAEYEHDADCYHLSTGTWCEGVFKRKFDNLNKLFQNEFASRLKSQRRKNDVMALRSLHTAGKKPVETVLLPVQLATPKAMDMWQKLQENGYADENFHFLTSKPKTAIIANIMIEELELKPKWKPFIELTGISDLSSQLSKAQLTMEFNDFETKILNILK